jgi:predicted nucleic acid-binding protein
VVLTSRLSVSECLTRPYRDKDESRIANMEAFFRTRVQMLSVDDALVEMATELHRDFSLKTIDALHVATALRAKADVFLTRDAGLHRYASLRGMRCEPIPS